MYGEMCRVQMSPRNALPHPPQLPEQRAGPSLLRCAMLVVAGPEGIKVTNLANKTQLPALCCDNNSCCCVPVDDLALAMLSSVSCRTALLADQSRLARREVLPRSRCNARITLLTVQHQSTVPFQRCKKSKTFSTSCKVQLGDLQPGCSSCSLHT